MVADRPLNLAGGVIAMRPCSFDITAESRTGSSMPHPLAPVTGDNGSIVAISAVSRNWHAEGGGGSAMTSAGDGMTGRGRGNGMIGESAEMAGRRRGSGAGSFARAWAQNSAAATPARASRSARELFRRHAIKTVASARED